MIVRKKSDWHINGLIVTILSLASCNYDSREEVMSPCTTDQSGFSSTVKPILANNCTVCHSTSNASGGLNFETYTGVYSPASDGRLVGSIKHLTGFAPMPQLAPKLSDCEIAKIEAWVNNGAPDN